VAGRFEFAARSGYKSRPAASHGRSTTEAKRLIGQRWMGGRAVEGTGLENRQARKGLVGSNPTPSANSAL
jgi:hypothetical protein